jgi:hypothetical protein
MSLHDTHVARADSRRTLRLEVLVKHEGRWRPGKLRAWHPAQDGTKLGLVTWNPVPGEIRIDRFPEDMIREP